MPVSPDYDLLLLALAGCGLMHEAIAPGQPTPWRQQPAPVHVFEIADAGRLPAPPLRRSPPPPTDED